nr:sister chromatid cohesion protein PDS5-like isoform X1 [Tanacetum cinerariifolium]
MKKLSSQKIGLNTDTRDSCLGPEDVFQLIVSSFEDLADQSSRAYIRRVLILETVSRVQSCVIMLDLECDGMIVEMFVHFLRSVRDYYRGVIFSSMENIMTLVLEESEDISVEMLKPLLAIKKHNEGVLPIAQKLGEEVLKKSAEKLKPYLMPALTALGDSLDSYTALAVTALGDPDICYCNSMSLNFNHFMAWSWCNVKDVIAVFA